jgi:hypothetical protein
MRVFLRGFGSNMSPLLSVIFRYDSHCRIVHGSRCCSHHIPQRRLSLFSNASSWVHPICHTNANGLPRNHSLAFSVRRATSKGPPADLLTSHDAQVLIYSTSCWINSRCSWGTLGGGMCHDACRLTGYAYKVPFLCYSWLITVASITVRAFYPCPRSVDQSV